MLSSSHSLGAPKNVLFCTFRYVFVHTCDLSLPITPTSHLPTSDQNLRPGSVPASRPISTWIAPFHPPSNSSNTLPFRVNGPQFPSSLIRLTTSKSSESFFVDYRYTCSNESFITVHRTDVTSMPPTLFFLQRTLRTPDLSLRHCFVSLTTLSAQFLQYGRASLGASQIV